MGTPQPQPPNPWAPPPAPYPDPAAPIPAPAPPAPELDDDPPGPGRQIAFGVPAAQVHGGPAVDVVAPPAGASTEDVARAWVGHLANAAAEFSAVLAVLPHGVVRKVLDEAGPVVEKLARGAIA